MTRFKFQLIINIIISVLSDTLAFRNRLGEI